MPFYQRKSPRLQGYDYSQSGAYFITICTHHRQYLFGAIQHGEIALLFAGEIAAVCWNVIPDHYPDIELDAFVVMPNHVHGIIVFAGQSDFKTILGRVINGYKGAVTARIRQHQPDLIIWQSRYYDHIIRSEDSLNRLRAYVEENPARWEEDKLFGQDL
ncbi:MAG: transposase [Chloroflexi bacterium]|nr:transposase [Chloroflexota bacterium]